MIGQEIEKAYYAPFPHPELADPDGLLCHGGNLEPEFLIHAYARGIFPWFSEGDPILWWSPDPRWILFPEKFHLPQRSWRKLKKFPFELVFNGDFEEVIGRCAELRRDGTWITDDMREAYTKLNRLGFAHSMEAWRNGKLVGGLYGVTLGKAFFGESMFHIETEASRAALWGLVNLLRKNDFVFIDCQQESEHMKAMGAEALPRKKFLPLVKQCAHWRAGFQNERQGRDSLFYNPERDEWVKI